MLHIRGFGGLCFLPFTLDFPRPAEKGENVWKTSVQCALDALAVPVQDVLFIYIISF